MPACAPSSALSSCLLAAMITASSLSLLAQHPAMQSAGSPDGGVRQTLESIFIPPKPGAPFTLTLDTEWTRPLANGGTYTLVNQRHIARDSAGRIYEERWLLVPKNGKRESTMNYLQIADPALHTLYNCQVVEKKCFLQAYTGSTATKYEPPVRPSGPLPDGSGVHTHEELGANSLFGFDTVGYRESTTLEPGTYGNDQPMTTTREFWYALSWASTLSPWWTAPRLENRPSPLPSSAPPNPSRSFLPCRPASRWSISAK